MIAFSPENVFPSIQDLLGAFWVMSAGGSLFSQIGYFKNLSRNFNMQAFYFERKFVILIHLGAKSPTLGTFSFYLGLLQQLVESTVNAERALFSQSPTFLLFLLKIK